MRYLLFTLLTAGFAFAHVGSPDVYSEGSAGPYRVLVTIQPPTVIPGVAQIGVRTTSNDVERIEVTPIPLIGEASKHPPTADALERSKDDPQYFTGSIWIMATGSWKVRVVAMGAQGRGEFSVPLPAAANQIKSMDWPLGAVLLVLLVVLVWGMVSIVGSGIRESTLDPGAMPGGRERRRARVAMAVTLAGVLGIVALGNVWWTAEASTHAQYLYKPLTMTPKLNGANLVLHLSDPGWIATRQVDDFSPDHGHLMHLYVLRWPAMDRVWHLHPDNTAPAEFTQHLPDMPAADYRLYADVVHANGFPETLVADLQLASGLHGRELQGDDAAGIARPVTGAQPDTSVAQLPDGWRMVWERPHAPLVVKKPVSFTFHLESPTGVEAHDLELYMGMPGHAAFVKTDGSVFAHIHPNGTAAMPALMMANANSDMHAMHHMDSAPPAEVSFPYGFPTTGEYRIVIQLKRAGKVETGMFNAKVGG